jgi:DNA-binding transcriptional LysR family regulator
MHDLNDFYFFAKVVEHRGFAAAGRVLNVPKSRLSRRVAQLEERLGVRLLQRSTRRFTVTELGQDFYTHCQAVLAEAQAAEEAVAQLRAEPRGLVRLSCPVSVTQNVMAEILPPFLARYPKVRVLVLSSNRRVDVIGEGVDIAIRIRFKIDTDADLVVRTFGRSRLLLVASPAYLDAHGRPTHPRDIAALDTISMNESDAAVPWELHDAAGVVERIEHRPRVMCGDFPLILRSAVAGLGVALLPESVCTQALQAGQLELVLADWSHLEGILHCVYPSRRGVLPAVRVLIDCLAEQLPCAVRDAVVGV